MKHFVESVKIVRLHMCRIMAAILLVMAAAALVFLRHLRAAAQRTARPQPLIQTFSKAVAFDVSPAVRTCRRLRTLVVQPNTVLEVRPERGPESSPRATAAMERCSRSDPAPTIPAPLLTLKGCQIRQLRPVWRPGEIRRPDGEVALTIMWRYQSVFAVYDNRATGYRTTKLGDLWTGFAIPDCTDPSGIRS